MRPAWSGAAAGRILGKVHWELGRPIEAVEAWHAAREADLASVDDRDYVNGLEQGIATAMSFRDFTAALRLRALLQEVDPEHAEVSPEALRLTREKLAEALRQDKKYREAIALYQELSRDFPDDPTYHFERGMLLLQQGKEEEAKEALVVYVDREKNGARYDLLIDIARRTERQGARGLAIYFYEQARQAMGDTKSSARAGLRLDMARLWLAAGEEKEGRQQLEAYLEEMRQTSRGGLSDAVYRKAVGVAMSHNAEGLVIDLLEEALEKAPPRWHLVEQLAEIYARRARPAEVERVLRRYVVRRDSSPQAQREAARWAMRRRDWDLAAHFYEALTTQERVDNRVWLDLSHVYANRGDTNKLKRAMENYLRGSDDRRYARLEAADLYRANRMFAEAEALLKEALRERADDLRLVDKLAQLYEEWGKPEQMHRIYKTWARKKGNRPQDWLLIGERFRNAGRHDDALPYLRQAAEAGERDAWIQIATIYKGQRKDLDMKDALDRYLETAPHRPLALKNVLNLYRHSSLRDETVAVLQELVQHDLGNLGLYESLSNLYQDQGRDREALELWKGYLQRSRGDRMRSLTRMAEYFQRRGRQDWVLQFYQELLREDGDKVEPELYRLIGDAFLSLHQNAGGLATIMRSRARFGRRPHLGPGAGAGGRQRARRHPQCRAHRRRSAPAGRGLLPAVPGVGHALAQ